MALTQFTQDVETIQALSDKPNEIEGLTADQLKKKFDDNAINFKSYINETLIPEIDTELTIATKEEAEAGTDNGKKMTPLRVKEAIDANVNEDGWVKFPTTLVFASADSPTGVVTTGADTRGYLEEGMKIKYDQVQAITCNWPLDSNSNDNKSAMNGTDTAITYSTGKFGNCAVFNGSTSKIVLADNALLKPTGPFTIGMWIKTASTGTNKTLFQSSSQNTNIAGIGIAINNVNNVRIYSGPNTSSTIFSNISGTTNVCDNNWHYIVCTFNNNYAQIYIDGKLDASGYSYSPTYSATNYVRIGCENASGTDVAFMNGSIDDLFLINGYALDEKTIRDKYIAQTAQGISDITITKMGFVSSEPLSNSLTLYHGTDFVLTNSAITNVYYSNVKKPYGFDINPDKWTIKATDTTDFNSGNITSLSTIYNFRTFAVPIGAFRLSGKCYAQVTIGSALGYLQAMIGLSTANNTFSDEELKSRGLASSLSMAVSRAPFYFEKAITNTTKTTYYLNGQSTLDNSTIIILGSHNTTVLKAECAYL